MQVWKSGGFFVPLSSHTRNRLNDILHASGAALIITNMEGVEAEKAVVWSIQPSLPPLFLLQVKF